MPEETTAPAPAGPMVTQIDPGRRVRRTKEDMERDWYGCFAKWDRADRSAALKALAVIHKHLPEEPKKVIEET